MLESKQIHHSSAPIAETAWYQSLGIHIPLYPAHFPLTAKGKQALQTGTEDCICIIISESCSSYLGSKLVWSVAMMVFKGDVCTQFTYTKSVERKNKYYDEEGKEKETKA